MEFEEIKQDILSKAKKLGACKTEYNRAYKSSTKESLLSVIVDNISWCFSEKMINTQYLVDNFYELLDQFGIYTTGYHIFKNKSVILLGLFYS